VPRSSGKVSADRLKAWARDGAEAALRQLRAEIIAIERTFPRTRAPEGKTCDSALC